MLSVPPGEIVGKELLLAVCEGVAVPTTVALSDPLLEVLLQPLRVAPPSQVVGLALADALAACTVSVGGCVDEALRESAAVRVPAPVAVLAALREGLPVELPPACQAVGVAESLAHPLEEAVPPITDALLLPLLVDALLALMQPVGLNEPVAVDEAGADAVSAEDIDFCAVIVSVTVADSELQTEELGLRDALGEGLSLCCAEQDPPLFPSQCCDGDGEALGEGVSDGDLRWDGLALVLPDGERERREDAEVEEERVAARLLVGEPLAEGVRVSVADPLALSPVAVTVPVEDREGLPEPVPVAQARGVVEAQPLPLAVLLRVAERLRTGVAVGSGEAHGEGRGETVIDGELELLAEGKGDELVAREAVLEGQGAALEDAHIVAF